MAKKKADVQDAIKAKLDKLNNFRAATKSIAPAIKKAQTIVNCIDVLSKKSILEDEKESLLAQKEYFEGILLQLANDLPDM